MNTWTKDFWNANTDECKKTLMEPGVWEKVPYYESVVSRELPNFKTLVRFRGMIQDMLNPEYYCKSFSIFNSVTKETKVCQGKYQRTVTSKPNEEIITGDDMEERQVISCIPIPGLNNWAKEIMNLNNEIDDQLDGNVQKRLRLDSDCVIKEMIIYIYPEDEKSTSELKLNNIIEVIGFIDRYSIDNIESADSMITDTDPNISVLSIHTVQFKLFPDLYKQSDEINNCIWEEASKLHVELKFILTQALLGDSLAADYLLFYLISTIYNRQCNEVPGKLSLNIRGFPVSIGENYIKNLYSLISYLVEKSKYLPLTIDNMNKMNMIPSKNYTTGRLTEGFLQLSNRTYLFIDETDLQPGKLENKGVLNVEAIKSIIENQQLKYDFTFYKIDYETQIPILCLSVGKSILPSDIDIVLTPDPSYVNNTEEIIDSVHKYLNSNLLLLDKLRKYITLISKFPFTFNEDILNIIQKDYVEMRREDAKNVSPDDLHHFIMISKLIALSTGKNELNNDIWEHCKILESQRKLRNK